MNRIIINADDFGLTKSKTDAICEAFQNGLISSTTFVANSSLFDYSVDLLNKYNINSTVGIHFNLTEGKPLTTKILSCESFVNNGVFKGKINRYKPLTKLEKEAVYEELTAQIEKLENAGIIVDHADSHHHVHTAFNIASIIKRICKEHNINKIRIHRNIGDISYLKKIGKDYYNNIILKNYMTTDLFGSMADVNKYGIYDNLEIMVHPDYNEVGLLIDKANEINGTSIGDALALPKGDCKLISYKDLI